MKESNNENPTNELQNANTEEVVNSSDLSPELNETLTSANESSTKPSEVELLKKEVERYKDLYLRSSADFENFKKQKEKQFIELRKYADEGAVKSLIPVLDDFSRALKSASENPNADVTTFLEGMKLIEQKFIKTFEERGVKRIDSLGKKLDVSYHEAFAQAEKEGVDPETIIEVFEEGYALHDKVIRHAKVVVAK